MGIASLTWIEFGAFFALIFAALAPGVVRGNTKQASLLKLAIGSLVLLVLLCAATVYTASDPCSFVELLMLQASGQACSLHSFIGWFNIVFGAASFVACVLLMLLAGTVGLLRHGR